MKDSQNISCLVVDDEQVAREIISSHLSKINNIKIVASCPNAIEAFQWINSTKIDLVFLDINMPEISGISFAKSINKDIRVIFTTAYRDYAVEGFELKAVDYLLKPISFERLLKSINRYFETLPTQDEPQTIYQLDNDFIFVRSDRKMIKIDFDSILYIESLSDYLKIHLANEVIVTRETISAIEAKLPHKMFMRIHRSYIISIHHISVYTNEFITIEKESIPISRSYKKDVLERLENL